MKMKIIHIHEVVIINEYKKAHFLNKRIKGSELVYVLLNKYDINKKKLWNLILKAEY